MGLFWKVSLFYKLVCPLKMSGKYLLCFVDLWSQNVIINPFPKDWNEIKSPQFYHFLLREKCKILLIKKIFTLKLLGVIFIQNYQIEKKTVDESVSFCLASYVYAQRASSEMGIKCQSVKLFWSSKKISLE